MTSTETLSGPLHTYLSRYLMPPMQKTHISALMWHLNMCLRVALRGNSLRDVESDGLRTLFRVHFFLGTHSAVLWRAVMTQDVVAVIGVTCAGSSKVSKVISCRHSRTSTERTYSFLHKDRESCAWARAHGDMRRTLVESPQKSSNLHCQMTKARAWMPHRKKSSEHEKGHASGFLALYHKRQQYWTDLRGWQRTSKFETGCKKSARTDQVCPQASGRTLEIFGFQTSSDTTWRLVNYPYGSSFLIWWWRPASTVACSE